MILHHQLVAMKVGPTESCVLLILFSFCFQAKHKWYVVVQVDIKRGRKTVTIRSPLRVRCLLFFLTKTLTNLKGVHRV